MKKNHKQGSTVLKSNTEIRELLTLDQKVRPEVKLLASQQEEVRKFLPQKTTIKLDILSKTTILELLNSTRVMQQSEKC